MQTIKLSMITLLTTVVMMPTGGWAATPEVTGEAVAKYETICEKDKDVLSGKMTLRACVASFNSTGGADGDPLYGACREAKKALEAPRSAFSKACGIFNLSAGKNCEEKVKECNDNLGDWAGEDDSESEPGKKKTVESDRYDVCPIPALEDAKLAKEKIEKLEGDIKDLDLKALEAQEKVEEAQAEIDKKETARLTANNKLKEEYAAELEEKGLASKKELEDAKTEISNIEKGIRELEQGKNDQDVQYAVDLAKIEGICEAVAEKALADQIQAQADKVNKNQLTKRNLQAQLTLKSEGRTSQNSEFRKNEIARCRATYEERWKKPIELLNLNYKNTRLKIENMIKDKLNERNEAYKKMSTDLPQKQQEEAQKLSAKYQAKSEAIKGEFDKEIGQCGNFSPTTANGKTNQTTVPNGCTGLNKVMADKVAAKANLEAKRDDLKSDLQYYTELLRLATSKISSAKAEDTNLLGAASDYDSAARDVVSACQGDESFARDRAKLEENLSKMGDYTPGVITRDPPKDVAGTDGIVPQGTTTSRTGGETVPSDK